MSNVYRLFFVERGVEKREESDDDASGNQEVGDFGAYVLFCLACLGKRFKQGILVRRRGQHTTFPLRNRERVDPEQLSELYLRQPELRPNS